MDVSPATPAAAGLSEEDAAALATPFVRALVRQIRSHDTTGVWESKSDTELLEPYVITAEQRRAMPVIADPNAKQLWRLDQYWAAAGLAVEQASGIIATPMTTSPLPSFDAAPRRRRGPNRTSPTLATVIGTPCGVAPITTDFRSSMLVTRPLVPITNCSRFRSM